MFQRILVGADGTTRALEAVSQAARLARVTGAGLEIVHVLRPAGPRTMGSGPRRLKAADDILREAELRAETERMRPVCRVLVGDPAEMLAREAAAAWCDLVAVGPDAKFTDRPRLLGRVATHLAHRGDPPVMVARAPAESETAGFPARILVAVDGSDSSMEAARLAAVISADAGAELRIAHVVPVTGRGRVGWTAEGREEGFEPLGDAVELARGIGVTASREMCLGRPGPAIARVAEEFDAELIVLGTHGRGGAGRLALGSVSDWVVRHADRSVLVARARSGTHSLPKTA